MVSSGCFGSKTHPICTSRASVLRVGCPFASCSVKVGGFINSALSACDAVSLALLREKTLPVGLFSVTYLAAPLFWQCTVQNVKIHYRVQKTTQVPLAVLVFVARIERRSCVTRFLGGFNK